MAHPPSYHVLNFSKMVQLMDQTQSKRLTLSAEDARSLHTEIFALLARITDLTETKNETETVSVAMDGGSFSKS